MLKYLLLILIITQSAFSQQISVDQRRKKILSIVEEELGEVSRLAKQQNFKSPDTLLRISELNLEKARLWREMENEQYLSIPPEKRRALNRLSYFQKSSRFFNDANDAALVVVNRFPNYKSIGDVYYILAYNFKELGENEKAKKYFALAANKAPSNSIVSSKAKLSLADYNFNEHKYKTAIPLYQASLDKVDEKWWTKDAFNLAWSYYRVKRYNEAIALMKQVHKKSSNKKYVDMRSLVERDIGIFFVDAGKVNEAIAFYEGLGMNYTEQFVKIATAIVQQGRFAQAESLLSQAIKTEKNRDRRIEIYLAQLNLTDKYGKVDSHLSVSKELVELHQKKSLKDDQFRALSYQVNKKAAELQKVTASSTYQNVDRVRKQKAAQAIAYFELASILNPSEKAEKIFFQGETAFAANLYLKSLNLYVKSFDISKETQNKKIMTQSLEGMLSALGQKNISLKTAERFYVPVYTRYLSVDSNSSRAHSIYVKLFNAYYSAGNISGAEKTLEDFAKTFPKDYKTQEGMLAKIMEYYRNKKDYSAVKSYVSKINAGQFRVSKKYADALRNLMTKIQIEGVQQSLEKGDKGVALKGYHQIFESSDSTPKARVNAAYNLTALYYELGDTNQSYQWSVRALKDMEVADVNKFADSFLSISAGMFLRQQFDISADMSYRLLAKLCKQNSSNKVVAYKNAVFISLANGNLDKALEIREFGKSCMIQDKAVTEVSLEVLKDLEKAKRWDQYEKLISELQLNSKNNPYLIKPLEELRLEYLKIGDVAKSREFESRQWNLFNLARTQKLDIPVEALDLMAEKMLASIIIKKQKIDQIKLQFPEGEFNNAVKQKLKLLDELTTEVNNIQKLGSGKGIVEAYRYVIDAYEDFGESLKGFVPSDKTPEYVSSFQKAMSDVYNPILANARKQRIEVRKLIMNNKILSESNYFVLYDKSNVTKRFVPVKHAILMEREGRK